MKTLQIAVALFLIAGCAGCATDSDETDRTVRKAGLTDVVVEGLTPFKCSEDDKIGRDFRATNARGEEVSGTVCCGILKGCTIRW